jgi:hypothetical protein
MLLTIEKKIKFRIKINDYKIIPRRRKDHIRIVDFDAIMMFSKLGLTLEDYEIEHLGLEKDVFNELEKMYGI